MEQAIRQNQGLRFTLCESRLLPNQVPRHRQTRDESVRLPSPDLHRHVGNMLATGVGGHVTFQVGKEAFVAHKNVLLVRSPVFMAKFFGGVME
jgi:hypothetical protein